MVAFREISVSREARVSDLRDFHVLEHLHSSRRMRRGRAEGERERKRKQNNLDSFS